MKTAQPASDRRIVLMISLAALILCAALGGFAWKIIPMLADGRVASIQAAASTAAQP